jgi:hypothetical protein
MLLRGLEPILSLGLGLDAEQSQWMTWDLFVRPNYLFDLEDIRPAGFVDNRCFHLYARQFLYCVFVAHTILPSTFLRANHQQ